MNTIQKPEYNPVALKPLFLCVCATALLALSSGCITTQQQARSDARIHADIMLLREDIIRAQGRVEGVEMECRRIAAELDQLREAVARSDSQSGGTARKLADIERRIEDVNAARARDREAVIEQISARMAELITKSGSARRGGTATTGYEHVVRSGETLSQIAAAYKVSPQAIIDANDLKNPDLLKQGQKLFIPGS